MHADPARQWRLEELAASIGMSRSNFALRFRELAGLSPLDYLVKWRMRLGAKALRTSPEPVSAIAYARLPIRKCLQQCLQAGNRHLAAALSPNAQ